jgi:hypothetical protein
MLYYNRRNSSKMSYVLKLTINPEVKQDYMYKPSIHSLEMNILLTGELGTFYELVKGRGSYYNKSTRP